MSALIDRFFLYKLRKHQDADAYARIYDRYIGAIYRFVFLKVPSKEDAEDISADVFLKCWNAIQEHTEIRDIRALLYQIARHSIADWYRASPGRSERTLAVTFSSSETSSIEQDVSDEGKERVVIEARAELALVMGKLERLKDDYRDVLMFRLVDNLPFNIIAQIMGRTTGHVRVLYHRAKKALDALESS
ncbi:MAG: RNA polymerase sigma factor [Patescibacteria group bacterium]